MNKTYTCPPKNVCQKPLISPLSKEPPLLTMKKKIFRKVYHITYHSIGNFMLFPNHVRNIVWKSIFQSVPSNIFFLPEIAILKVSVIYRSLLCMRGRCFYSCVCVCVCVCVLYFFFNWFPFYFSNLMYDFVMFDVWLFNS